MRLHRKPTAAISVAVTVLVGMVLLLSSVSTVRSQNARGAWQQLSMSDILPQDALPTGIQFSEIQLVDNTTAWLVGSKPVERTLPDEGFVYKLTFENGRWGLAERYTFPYSVQNLEATPDGVWAVAEGYTGGYCCYHYRQIIHKDANGWHEETKPDNSNYIYTFSMLPGGKEGWAAGSSYTRNCHFVCTESYVLHYSNAVWTRDNTANEFGRSVSSIEFTGTIGYAVGETIQKYDGHSWTEIALPDLGPVPTAPPALEPCPGLYFACVSFSKVKVLSPDEFWAFGIRFSTLSEAEPILLHMNHGQWQVVMPGNSILENRPAGTEPLLEAGFSMGSDGYGFMATSPSHILLKNAFPQIVRVTPDGSLSYEQIPQIEHTKILSITNTDDNHVLALGQQEMQVVNGNDVRYQVTPILLSYRYDAEAATASPTPNVPLPTDSTGDQHYSGRLYFPQVGHNLHGAFLAFWAEHGGIAQFGYPITEEFTEVLPADGKSYTVQYFERARLEWHPENGPPNNVQIGLLGLAAIKGREAEPPFVPVTFAEGQSGIGFPQTQHTLAEPFLSYWQQHGGLTLYGYPLSEAFTETSPTDGKPYLVQYFERARFELHPELGELFRVSVGLLGTEALKVRAWLSH